MGLKVKTILIVEDDNNLSRGISFSFEKEGFAVRSAQTLSAGINIFNHNVIDLVILDLNLPDGDGVAFCKTIREKSNVPILILTARDMETDELEGLTAGADDYITKPFSISILRARAENLLRRFSSSIIHAGIFSLDTNLCKFYRATDEIPISTTEFRLLKLFMSNIGKVLSKEQISAVLWERQEEYVDDNALSVNISRLRSKIKDKKIKTIHGIGYVWGSD